MPFNIAFNLAVAIVPVQVNDIRRSLSLAPQALKPTCIEKSFIAK